jgi:hypothetical protein
MVERKIIEEKVRKFVKELKREKIRVTKVILYGSRIREWLAGHIYTVNGHNWSFLLCFFYRRRYK